MISRYEVSGDQGAYEPGSDEQVLANKLGICSAEEMDALELGLLEQLYESVFSESFPEGRLSVADLRTWHRRWLGNVYSWAGEDRAVNLSKDDFHFAASAQVPRLLTEFEDRHLERWTPCHGLDGTSLVEAIAITHVEFILIHPFREGNGRLSRLLADVMAVQAGLSTLDYSVWDADKDRYFGAIRSGVARGYEPMVVLVREAIAES